MKKKIPNNEIKIFDTTLRDGEQSPGASMNYQPDKWIKLFKATERSITDCLPLAWANSSDSKFN